MRESFEAISQNLQKLVHESASKAEAAKSLQTLLMILQNVRNNPTSEKHRKVNTTGSRFRELFSTKGAPSELLKLAGFTYQEPNFTYGAEQSTEALERVRDLMTDSQRTLDQTWASRPPDAAPPAASEAAPATAESGLVGLPAELRPEETPGQAVAPAGLPHATSATSGSASMPRPAQAARPWANNMRPAFRPEQRPPAEEEPRSEQPASSSSSHVHAPVMGASPGGFAQSPPVVAHPAESPAVAHPAESQEWTAPHLGGFPATGPWGSLPRSGPPTALQPEVGALIAHPAASEGAAHQSLQAAEEPPAQSGASAAG